MWLNVAKTFGVTHGGWMMSSPPVNSLVSPKIIVAPDFSKRSKTRPTVGQEDKPVVVSDSPHLVLMTSLLTGNGSRGICVAYWTNSWALRAALAMVIKSPVHSIVNAATGLPVFLISLTMRSVQTG